MTTQIDVLNAQIANNQAKKVANSADVNLKNTLLDQAIAAWQKQIDDLNTPPQS